MKLHNKQFVIGAILISLFFVVFNWNFWYGVVGLNIMIFWLAIIGLFIAIKREILNKQSLKWLVPILIIIISLGIYTNIFTGWISLLALPFILFIFTTHEAHQNIRLEMWSKFLPVSLIISTFLFLTSISGFARDLKNKRKKVSISNKQVSILWQIIAGVLILIIFSLVIVIPLLSSADQSFANIFSSISQYITSLFDSFDFLASLITRSIIFTIIFFILICAIYYWQKKIQSHITINNTEIDKNKHSVIIGIVLGGTLILYLLFIIVQIKTIFISNLPIDFAETESVVKTGFWQLFILTIMNILFYIGLYNKKTKNIQHILMGFTITSLLLIVSAGYRVFLYVINYGLSYEKFFAFYTVIFCIIIFLWFISLFIYYNKEINIIKTIAFLSLAMYAFITIIPLEKIIFITNLNLTQRENSRVDLNELRMLGFDALPVVEKNYDQLIEESRKDYLQKNKTYLKTIEDNNATSSNKHLKENVDDEWDKWIQLTKKSSIYYYHWSDYYEEKLEKYQKRWYEKNIVELMYYWLN
jgi:hypothetical protein